MGRGCRVGSGGQAEVTEDHSTPHTRLRSRGGGPRIPRRDRKTFSRALYLRRKGREWGGFRSYLKMKSAQEALSLGRPTWVLERSQTSGGQGDEEVGRGGIQEVISVPAS